MRIADPEETLKNLQMFLEDLQQYRDLLGDEERFDDAEKKRSLLNQNYGVVADDLRELQAPQNAFFNGRCPARIFRPRPIACSTEPIASCSVSPCT